MMHINKHGDISWINHEGLYHREDSPALTWASGLKEWYINGKLHRENGPAIEYTDGSKSWYLDDVRYTHQEFKRKMRLKKIKALK